jgi:hypothetical protein
VLTGLRDSSRSVGEKARRKGVSVPVGAIKVDRFLTEQNLSALPRSSKTTIGNHPLKNRVMLGNYCSGSLASLGIYNEET